MLAAVETGGWSWEPLLVVAGGVALIAAMIYRYLTRRGGAA